MPDEISYEACFKSKAIVPLDGEPKTCGLCALYEMCRLPSRRNRDNNGITQYPGKVMDTKAAGVADGTRNKKRWRR